jgi:signal transduction histidine kinase
MTVPPILLIYFFYGLSFFSMGLLVAIEGGRSADPRLRRALRPLAGFGLLHGLNEWLDLYLKIETLLGSKQTSIHEGFRLAILAFSFLSLAAFGVSLLAKTQASQRIVLVVPLGLEGLWVFGLLIFRGIYSADQIMSVADVWTRYILAIPAGILAAVGLVAQQRAFRQSGLVRFGQDALWAAVAFGWYGIIGQLFTMASPLPPSNFLNQDLFQSIFGFPIQLLRAATAMAAAVFVIRFLRAFQVESERKIADLQAARLQEAQQREALRGELFNRVVAAQEVERQRIARELHDETGQSLTAIGMGLRGMVSTLRQKDTKRADQILHNLEKLSSESLVELQRLIADLRPSHLDDLGLASALRWYASDIQERTSLDVRVEISGEEHPVSAPAKTALFRIVQEALNNVIKHAEAKIVKIRLRFSSDAVDVQVSDDGHGFDPQARGSGGRVSWGLRNMEERATLLGGKFQVRSSPGRGTTLDVSVPYVPGNEVSNDNPSASGG